ncbi:hypothetical protein PBY51_014439 [Eleginops maclovinus]|uniref:Uncharacterized protein n=1 Tax=Eleginops maclovinus TaxID=56733 RepID=A0AAN8A4T9_ELEMC|nr:hypothetical protein PBY51_014439 [Eleginops maclovinus]
MPVPSALVLEPAVIKHIHQIMIVLPGMAHWGNQTTIQVTMTSARSLAQSMHSPCNMLTMMNLSLPLFRQSLVSRSIQAQQKTFLRSESPFMTSGQQVLTA